MIIDILTTYYKEYDQAGYVGTRAVHRAHKPGNQEAVIATGEGNLSKFKSDMTEAGHAIRQQENVQIYVNKSKQETP